jgi:hypothetical protein
MEHPSVAQASEAFTPERWRQFWSAWKGEPQQQAGAEELRQRIAELAPELLTEEASWVCNFRKGHPEARPAPAQQEIIPAPYYCQLLMDDGQGWRDCFSATSAMIAAWKGKVSDENTYNHIRQKHGDSTVAASQIAALSDLGLMAHYATNGSKAKLIELLDRGIPVGCGILHHGMASCPTGGGHWMLIIGHNEHGVIANDPYGDLNVANGTWVTQGSGGSHITYSWKNWLPRWEVSGGDGYMLWCE